ncbi:MAG: energy-coupling factor ABC transporter ATP-binding protein [Proteobacteria bacterium]|nr:energy-coupling factor ABC transporter ATP-binding protein [Pseudomonadota bacterium]MBU1058208.1 energy-coupling factor ABC transporter ATP-binding protein [Pseudomonadota bacterium]
MTTLPPLIELRNITYSYPGRTTPILEEVNFSICDERIGLIGPNGCGKTTLFQIIMGLLTPDRGEVLLEGMVMAGEKDFRILRRKLGFLFQNSDDQLFSPTVLEDVAFGPLNLGSTAEEAREISGRTLEGLGLKGFEDRITHRLSGGEKKLVALATILSMQPHLLLLDEPSNNLDPETRERLIAILRGLNQAHIIISHDLDFLASTCSHLYTIDKRRLIPCKEKQIHSHDHIHPYGDHPHQHGT